MPRIFFPILVFILSGNACLSQTDSLLQQINQQVWKPFMQTFNDLDTDGFMKLHSKEMTRVIQDSKVIYGYERYYEQNQRGNESAKSSGSKRTLELRFLQRIAGNDKAFEVGYFKVASTQSDGQLRTFYGKFHILLRKENGTWKILMDADAREEVNEKMFMSGQPL